MKKRFLWGLGILIVLLIGVSAFFLMRNTDPEPRDVYKDREPSLKMPPAESGYIWVWHGDHWDKVKIAEVAAEPVPSKIGGQEKTNTAPKPKPQKVYEGTLTYHEELLKTNPVKALRLQSEERGHFSAQCIPPFPPDDTEAQAYARAIYLITYYKSIGETDIPEYKAAVENYTTIGRPIGKYTNEARNSDLLKLGWARFDEQPHEVYYPHGFRVGPSEYFPRWRSEAEKRAHYKKSGFYDLFMQIEKLQEQGLLPE